MSRETEILLTCRLKQSRILPIERSATDGCQIREDAQVRHVFWPWLNVQEAYRGQKKTTRIESVPEMTNTGYTPQIQIKPGSSHPCVYVMPAQTDSESSNEWDMMTLFLIFFFLNNRSKHSLSNVISFWRATSLSPRSPSTSEKTKHVKLHVMKIMTSFLPVPPPSFL